jgi:hypothetical protein
MTSGAKIRIDPKSGCRANKRNSTHTIEKYGIAPSLIRAIRDFFFFRKKARKMMIPIFANSTGWIDGSHGISSHPFAPLYSFPIIRTIVMIA